MTGNEFVKEALLAKGLEFAKKLRAKASPAAAPSFTDKLKKGLTEGHGYHALEVGGLGTLAAPSVAHMAGHDMSEDTKHKLEIGGLGALALPSAIHLLSKGKK